MRIAICDYSGHPFQVQLSRELARRGHSLLHLHFADFQTPKGQLELKSSDPKTLTITGVSLGEPFLKHSFILRRSQEIEVGLRFAKEICDFVPDVAVGCNLPLDSLMEVVRSCQQAKIPFVLWLQDLHSVAISIISSEKLGLFGREVGEFYRRLEAGALAMSTAIITIADDFSAALANSFGVLKEKVHVIENWAPLDELTPRPRANAWSESHGLTNSKVVLYSGTLGVKHDPGLILACADGLRSDEQAIVVVVSEGPAAAWLDQEAKKADRKNLLVLPFQPFEQYANVLGTADVLIAILNQNAGLFSVPSKILSYLCASRPIVLSAPLENLASRIINKSRSGSVVPSGNQKAFTEAVKRLLENPQERAVASHNARLYAERAFEISSIADRFDGVFQAALGQVN